MSGTASTPVRASRQDLPLLSRRGGAWGGFWSAVVVATLAVLIVRRWTPLMTFDQQALEWIRRWALENPWAITASRWLYTIGSWRVAFWVGLAGVLVLLARRRYWQALTLALLASLAPFITHLIKPWVGRPRPTWDVVFATEHTLSYPSGHATGGIAVYAAVGVALGSLFANKTTGALLALPFLLLGVAIGLSRLVLGVHYPSDVVGGWFVALAVAGVLGALFVLPPYRGDLSPPRTRH